MKIKAQVVRIEQRPRTGEKGEVLMTTIIKLATLGIMGGELTLQFGSADVVFHPETYLTDPRDRRQITKTIIPEGSLITEATVEVDGEPCTFFGSVPSSGEPREVAYKNNAVVTTRDAPVFDLAFGE